MTIRFVCIDWGGTLMSEEGPLDVPMADWQEIRVMPGARALLAALAPTHTLCIATNAAVSRRGDIERALARGGLIEFISEIFCFTEIGAKKSAAEFWTIVTNRLGCSATEIAMLGDSLEEDVLGPSRHGIFSVWFNAQAQEVPPGVRAVTRLGDFVSLLP